VVPELIPVTRPEEFTLAMAVFPLLQMPPVAAMEKGDEEPTQMLVAPVMGAGTAFVVIAFITLQPPATV
jgi:2-phospho-L-lactate guanylyltransferase (CobY/MobA/RfbA family)